MLEVRWDCGRLRLRYFAATELFTGLHGRKHHLCTQDTIFLPLELLGLEKVITKQFILVLRTKKRKRPAMEETKEAIAEKKKRELTEKRKRERSLQRNQQKQ